LLFIDLEIVNVEFGYEGTPETLFVVIRFMIMWRFQRLIKVRGSIQTF
jgi:hypothetical protein